MKHNTAYDSFQSSFVVRTLMCRPVRGGPGLLHIGNQPWILFRR